MIGHKTRHVAQRNQVEDPGTNLHTCVYLSFDKEARNTPWEKKASSTKGAGQAGCQHAAECKFIHTITLHKTQVQVNQRPQHNNRYTEHNRRKCGH